MIGQWLLHLRCIPLVKLSDTGASSRHTEGATENGGPASGAECVGLQRLSAAHTAVRPAALLLADIPGAVLRHRKAALLSPVAQIIESQACRHMHDNIIHVSKIQMCTASTMINWLQKHKQTANSMPHLELDRQVQCRSAGCEVPGRGATSPTPHRVRLPA